MLISSTVYAGSFAPSFGVTFEIVLCWPSVRFKFDPVSGLNSNDCDEPYGKVCFSTITVASWRFVNTHRTVSPGPTWIAAPSPDRVESASGVVPWAPWKQLTSVRSQSDGMLI